MLFIYAFSVDGCRGWKVPAFAMASEPEAGRQRQGLAFEAILDVEFLDVAELDLEMGAVLPLLGITDDRADSPAVAAEAFE